MVDCGIQLEECVLDLVREQRERNVEFRIVRSEDLDEVCESETSDFRIVDDQQLVIKEQELKTRCLQIHEKTGKDNANNRQKTPFPQSGDHGAMVQESFARRRVWLQTRQGCRAYPPLRHLLPQLLPPQRLPLPLLQLLFLSRHQQLPLLCLFPPLSLP